MHFVSLQEDRGKYLIDASGEPDPALNESMLVIFDGQLAVTAKFDTGQEFVIDYIGKGTIINGYNFLHRRKQTASFKCLSAVTYFYLNKNRLREIAMAYPELR